MSRTWPSDAWPTPAELVEFARISPTAEVTEYFDGLIRHAARGRDCLVRGHSNRIAGLLVTVMDLTSERNRARLAARNARRRAARIRRDWERAVS